MWLVRFALRRPYTIAALTVLVCLFGVFSARRTPTDIFPEINIPVVSVVWSYNGMSAREIQTRIIDKHERSLASLVDDMERVESNSYYGVGVIKIYLHEGASISQRRLAGHQQRPDRAQEHAAQYHPSAGRPLQRDGRADHPVEPGQRYAPGRQAQRLRTERDPPVPGHRAGRAGAVSLRRQAAPDHGGPGQRRRFAPRT